MSNKQVSETEETVSKETICHWLKCSSSHPSPVPHAPPPGPPHPVGVPTQPLPAKPFRHHHRCPAAWCIPVDLIGANAVTPTYPAKSWFPTLGPKPLQGELLHHINPPLPLLERIRGNLQSKRHGSIICMLLHQSWRRRPCDPCQDTKMKYPPMSGVFAMLKDKCGIASNGRRQVSGSPARPTKKIGAVNHRCVQCL